MKEKFISLEGLPYSSRLLPSNDLEKVAQAAGKGSYGYKYDDQLLKFLSRLKASPSYSYILVNALGAGEYYGPNFNHDYFPEKELLSNAKDPFGNALGYKSFLSAGVYRDHQNARQNGTPFGDVVCAVYNHAMHRVELVLRVDRTKAVKLGHTDIIDAVDNGDVIQVSMAVLVPYDICSNCLNQSRQPDGSDSCDCVKGSIGNDGKKVCMINVSLKFHDMSFVVIQGDSLGFMVEKVASRNRGVPMKPRYAVDYEVIREERPGKSKQALKVKKINALSATAFKPGQPILFDTIHNSCKGGDFEVLSFLALMTEHGIILSPAEFYTALASPHSRALARRFYSLRHVPRSDIMTTPLVLATPSCVTTDPIPMRRSIFSESPEFPLNQNYVAPKTYAFQKMASRYNDYRAGVAITLAKKLSLREKTATRHHHKILAALIAETGAGTEILKHINHAITA